MAISTVDVIRTWTDEQYRRSLSPSDREQFPAHPAGELALTDADMQAISGNDSKVIENAWTTFHTCSLTTYCLTTGPCC